MLKPASNIVLGSSKTLGAHHLAPVRRRDARYSSRRAPQRTLPGEEAVSAAWGWVGENRYASGFDSPAALLEGRFEHLEKHFSD